VFRAVRRKLGLRQIDAAAAADLSDSTVSLIERGRWRSLSFDTVERLAAVLGIRLNLDAWWRGGDASRLVSRSHSLLAAGFAGFASGVKGWQFEPEVSFAIYSERGVIDQLGWFAGLRHLLIVELKTEFTDINEVMATADRRLRLAPAIGRLRGWEPERISYWLVVLDTRTNRRHASDHRALLRAKFPQDGRQLRRFLRDPSGPTFGLAFWTDSNALGVGRGAAGAKSRVRLRAGSSAARNGA